MKKEAVLHLLIKGEFKVWCRPSESAATLGGITNQPLKATCVNCLNSYRNHTGRNHSRRSLSIRHTLGRSDAQETYLRHPDYINRDKE